MKYGNKSTLSCTTKQWRVSTFLMSMDIQLGNGGLSKEAQKFLKENQDNIEDAFINDDSMYILPKTREFAKKLYETILGKALTDNDYTAGADEVDWVEVEGRFWLSLWWD